MLDVNLLSKDVRAKKQIEIERIKIYAPKHSDLARGGKIGKKTLTVNFFSRFFGRSAQKKQAEESAVAPQSILQTPKETPPPQPPEIPPYPLNPVSAPEVMKAPMPKPQPVPVEPKQAITPIKKAADGIILPDISTLIQKQTVFPVKIESASKPEFKHEAPKVAPPLPPKAPKPVSEITVMPKQVKKEAPVEIKKVEIGLDKKAEISVMPKKEFVKPVPSIFGMALAGTLTIVFAASFLAGAFFVLNRQVSAFEKVKNAYGEQAAAAERSMKSVDQPVKEVSGLMQKTQILFEVFQAQSRAAQKEN